MFKKRIIHIGTLAKDFNSLVDIGTDHAYLPIYLALNYDYKHILATDINSGPLEAAKKNIAKYHLENIIELKLCDGLDQIEGKYDLLSICGMGGKLITNILEKGLNKIDNFSYLILSPNNNQHFVREFLAQNNYEIVDESNVFDYKYYEVIVAKKSLNKVDYSDLEIKYGPILLKKKNDLFIAHYEADLKHLKEKNSPYLVKQIEELEKKY